jgi:hypothetical protein
MVLPSDMAPESLPCVCAQLCWPFNTLIQSGSGYSFDFQAEDIALDALGWDVMNETLSLFTASDFQSAYPVILVVCAPASCKHLNLSIPEL